MSILTPVQTISTDLDRAEVHFSIGGLWPVEEMEVFLRDLGRSAKPFIEAQKPFTAIADLREFVAQSRETADAIRESLLLAQKNGMTRFAVIADASLVKLQYRRITEGVEARFFDGRPEALAWLRS